MLIPSGIYWKEPSKENKENALYVAQAFGNNARNVIWDSEMQIVFLFGISSLDIILNRHFELEFEKKYQLIGSMLLKFK